jgi:hypothetical protein
MDAYAKYVVNMGIWIDGLFMNDHSKIQLTNMVHPFHSNAIHPTVRRIHT